MSETFRFDDRVAIVTGAGGGLGRAHARLLAARGAKVVVNDLGATLQGEGSDQGPAARVVAEIKAAGGEAVANGDSVTDGARLVQCAFDSFGRIDIVVNNAGVLRDRAFHNMSAEEWDYVLDVHLTGAFSVSRAAWTAMRAQRYGRLVFTTSSAGLFGNFGQANYAAAKMGLIGLCRTLAVEGAAAGIHANVIGPSAASRMSGTIAPDEAMSTLTPELVSPLVAYLCHHECSANGRIYAAGGGWVGEIRLQQSRGARLGDHDIEALARRWVEVSDFDGATAPETIADAVVPIIEDHPALQALFGRPA